MRHDKRRCGCGALFELATLMSREKYCPVCRSGRHTIESMAVQLARQHEQPPQQNGVRIGGLRDPVAKGQAVQPLSRAALRGCPCDACMMAYQYASYPSGVRL